MTVWTAGRGELPDPARPEPTAVIRSDDGAMLAFRSSNRDGAQFFDYVRGPLRMNVAGAPPDAGDTAGIFTVLLSHSLEMLALTEPGRAAPRRRRPSSPGSKPTSSPRSRPGTSWLRRRSRSRRSSSDEWRINRGALSPGGPPGATPVFDSGPWDKENEDRNWLKARAHQASAPDARDRVNDTEIGHGAPSRRARGAA
jgi:hypothetical protein